MRLLGCLASEPSNHLAGTRRQFVVILHDEKITADAAWRVDLRQARRMRGSLERGPSVPTRSLHPNLSQNSAATFASTK